MKTNVSEAQVGAVSSMKQREMVKAFGRDAVPAKPGFLSGVFSGLTRLLTSGQQLNERTPKVIHDEVDVTPHGE